MAPRNNSTPKSTPKQAKTMSLKKQGKAQTPQPSKDNKPTPLKKTPKSAPPAKRKKLSQEIDEEISDTEFETVLAGVKAKEKHKKLTGTVTPKKPDFDEEDSDEDDDDFGEEDIDDDSDDMDSEEADSEDDDDEEDDEDDDDSGEELDESEMAKILKKLTSKGTDDDDDDDDEDDDDYEFDDSDDKSEEDDDEESEEEVFSKKTDKTKSSAKETKKKQTKQEQKRPEKQTKQDKLQKSKTDTKNPKKESGGKEFVDECTLFVKNLPDSADEAFFKGICKGLQHMRFRSLHNKKIKNRKYAHLGFQDEATTEKNYKLLTGRKIGNVEIDVDFVGTRSKYASKKAPPPGEADDHKLFVQGFSKSMTEEKLRELFPKASQIFMPVKKKGNRPVGYAFINYKKKDECQTAMLTVNGKVVGERTLLVVPGKKRQGTKRPAPQEKKAEQPKKKKVVKQEDKEEEEMDDDDDLGDSDEEQDGASDMDDDDDVGDDDDDDEDDDDSDE